MLLILSKKICVKIRYDETILLLKDQILHLKEETVNKNKQINILLNFVRKNEKIGRSQIDDVVETIPVFNSDVLNSTEHTVFPKDLNDNGNDALECSDGELRISTNTSLNDI